MQIESRYIIVILSDNKITIWKEFIDSFSYIDSIHIGFVKKVINNIAYIDIGESKLGILNINDPNIKNGESILVQIKREKGKNKGPVLSQELKFIYDNFDIFLNTSKIYFSNSINDNQQIIRLRKIAYNILNKKYGVFFKNSSINCSNNTIKKQLSKSIEEIDNILSLYNYSNRPKCVFSKKNTFETFLKSNELYTIKHINTNIKYKISSEINMNLIEDDMSFSRIPYIKNADKIIIEDGSNIVYNECEALKVFDVNTASSTNNFFIVNMLASETIIKSILYNNISGIILIDFINMKTDEEYLFLLKYINECFKLDYTRTEIHGFTKTGLLEITRRKIDNEEKDE